MIVARHPPRGLPEAPLTRVPDSQVVGVVVVERLIEAVDEYCDPAADVARVQIEDSLPEARPNRRLHRPRRAQRR